MSFSGNNVLAGLQNHRDLYYGSPTGACHEFHTPSLSHWRFPKPRIYLIRCSQGQGWGHHGLDQMQCSFLLGVLFKTGSLLCYLCHGLDQFPRCEMCGRQNLKRPARHHVSSLWKIQDVVLCICLKEVSWHALTNRPLKTSLNCPLNLQRVSLPPSGAHVMYPGLQCTASLPQHRDGDMIEWFV